MSMLFERTVARRYLRSRKREGFISVIAGFSFIGIMLGVATLIIVMSVMNGFRAELIGRVLGLNGHLNAYSSIGTMKNYEPMMKRIKTSVNGVTHVFPTIEGQALMSANDIAAGVIVRGMRAEDLAAKPVLSDSIILPADFRTLFPKNNSIAIGVKMADKFGLRLGDVMTLISPKTKSSPFGGTNIRQKDFVVSAIFDVGMYEYDSSFVFIPLEMAQKFYLMIDGISALEIMTDDPQNVDTTKRDIIRALEGGAAVADWRDSNASFVNALEVERNVMFLILTLIILVAAFNIISSLIMLVKDKSRDIAILRTMGATRGMIIRVFFITGARIGIWGTLAGAVLGIAFAANIESIRQGLQKMTGWTVFPDEIYFLSQLPAKIDTNEVVMIVLMALFLSFAATVYPAWRAARLDPVEALRYE